MTILVVMTLFSFVSNSQGFSKRDDHDLPSLYLHVINQPYGYQIIGREYDSIAQNLEIPAIVRGFDWTGNEIYTKSYSVANSIIDPNLDCNARLNDSTTVFAARCNVINNDTSYIMLVWLKNNGDTIMTRKYTSPYNNTYSNVANALETSDDGQFIYYAAQVGAGSSGQNNFIIRKISAQGEELWTYINPLSNYYFYCAVLYLYDGKVWFQIAGQFSRLQSLDAITRTLIDDVELDGASFPIYQANGMDMDVNGVVTAGIYPNAEFELLPVIYKMNYDGSYLWHTTPDGDFANNQNNDHLTFSQDGGYVSASVKYDHVPSIENPEDPSEDNYNNRIWLWKVDNQGEFQWQRFYEYYSFDSTEYYRLYNIAHDMKSTPDGGYIMAGEARATCSNYPDCTEFTQQGWLLKVDGCGCLVPGCDELCISAVGEEKKQISYLKIGPNPVAENLNVYLSAAVPNHGTTTLEIYSGSGILIKSFNLRHHDTTYIIDTSAFSSGVYILVLKNNSETLQVEKVVIER